MSFDYEVAVTRNSGYISTDVQSKMKTTRLLIAGCGIGSSPAICAARMGFENFVLVDGDVVDAHNLNRQFYDFADVGMAKVDALKEKILRINPEANVEAIRDYLDAGNTADIVAKADVIFDTVDFLDLPAILRLHTTSRQHNVPIFTALSVGFGALVWFFPADSSVTFSEILAPDVSTMSVGGVAPSYADVFSSFIRRIAPYLDKEVTEQIDKVLTMMKDGRPCPASQVAVGSFAIGAMAMSMIHGFLAGHAIPSAPELVLHSFKRHHTTVLDVVNQRARRID